MYYDTEEAFKQGVSDAWSDKEENPKQYQTPEAQAAYTEAYRATIKYMNKLADDY
jgi:hypothetical protein